MQNNKGDMTDDSKDRDSNSGSRSRHPVYENDPVYFHSLLNRYAAVHTNDGKEHKGWIHTVDPVSARLA